MFIFVWEANCARNPSSKVRSDKESAVEFLWDLPMREIPDWIIIQDEDSQEFSTHSGSQFVIDNLL
jgi:hypothetical protein